MARTSWARLNCRLAILETRWAVTERMIRSYKRMTQTMLEVDSLSMLMAVPGLVLMLQYLAERQRD